MLLLAITWPTMLVTLKACNLPQQIVNIKDNMGQLKETPKGQ